MVLWRDVTGQNKGQSVDVGEEWIRGCRRVFCFFASCSLHHGQQGTVSLASSSDSEEGAAPSPPRKKLRVSAGSNMQANGCSAHNGQEASTSALNGATACVTNGTLQENPVVLNSQTDKDIVRLIGQHLRSLGLKWNIASTRLKFCWIPAHPTWSPFPPSIQSKSESALIQVKPWRQIGARALLESMLTPIKPYIKPYTKNIASIRLKFGEFLLLFF